MKTLVGVGALDAPSKGTCLTVGTFDGLHVGHRALIARTQEEARDAGALSCVVTWDRHPFETLRPDALPPMLTTPERRAELIQATGVDILVVLPFDEEFSKWPPEKFVQDVLVDGLNARAVFVGDGWRFGHKAAGDVALLEKMGAEHGYAVGGVTLAEAAGDSVSSTRVRKAVGFGEMEVAHALLGRPFDVDGLVMRGDRRGTRLGFPTANVAVDESLAHPPRGVYAGRARTPEGWYKAAVNVGVNPTFGGDPGTSPWRIESYLLDFDGDLYDQVIRVEYHKRLRDEERFDSVEALLERMAEDVEVTRRLIGD